MNNITEQGDPDFDWATYESEDFKGYNKDIQKIYPESRVLCRKDYALDLYELMLDYPVKIKDVQDGDIVQITSIEPVEEYTVLVTTYNGLSLRVDLTKEKRFCGFYDLTPEDLWEVLQSPENQTEILESEPVYIEIKNTSQGIIGSLSKARDHKVQHDFLEEIKSPSSAYQAKVVGLNKGGFFVKVQGIDAFLPGGLAAANKITNFESYLGKEIPVMIEDYLKDNDTFIVSNKKYLDHILPGKIANLSLDKEYKGTVTGTAKFGIFIEFDEIFTGLIHVSKMIKETKELFKNREIKAGDEMYFWIKEITDTNKIILSEENPMLKKIAFDQFKESSVGMIKEGKVISNKPFGTLVKMEKDIIGLISKKELKTKNIFPEVGGTIMVTVDDIKKNKIYLSLPNEA